MKITIDLKDIIILVLIGLLIYGNLGKIFHWNDDNKTKIEQKIEVKHDTIYFKEVVIKQPIVTNTYKEIAVMVKDTSSIGVDTMKEIKVNLPLNEYKDSVKVDDTTIYYDHKIAGYLESSKYKISVPIKTITNTETKTITKNRIFDVFGVAGHDLNASNVSLGADIVFKRLKVGYRINNSSELKGVHSIEIGYRLFGY